MATSRPCARCSPTARTRSTACSAWGTRSATVPIRWPAWTWWPSGPRPAWPAITSTRWRAGCASTWFNHYARAAAEWTQERLDDDHRAYLIALPLTRRSPTLPSCTPRRSSPERVGLSGHRRGRASRRSAPSRRRCCFVGPFATCRASGRWAPPARSTGLASRLVQAERGRRYLVNVGSVGQPRDRDPRAAYATLGRRGRPPAASAGSTTMSPAARRKILEARACRASSPTAWPPDA